MITENSKHVLKKYYLISIIIIIIIGVLSTFLTYREVKKNTKKELLKNVSIIAYSLDLEKIKSLTGQASDTENLDYIFIKSKLNNIFKNTENIRFIYLVKYINNEVVFLVDSEEPTSKDYSPPGQIYTEASPLFKEISIGNLGENIELSEDRWGHWLTAIIPIKDENNQTISVLGLDMPSNIYYKEIYTTLSIPILSTIFVLLIITIGLILKKREDEYWKLKEKLLTTARHDLRAPLTGISWVTETLLNSKNKIENEDRENIEIIYKKVKNLIENVNEIIENK